MDGMSKETLELIQDTAVRAANAANKVEFKKPSNEPDHVYYAIKADGTLSERFEAAPKPINQVIVGIPEVVEYVERNGGDETQVWFSDTQIVVVLDKKTRRDVAVLKLTKTPQLRLLEEIEKSAKRYQQKDFVRLLQVDLRDCLTDRTLLNFAKSCKFNSVANSGGAMAKQRESFGKDIDQTIQSDVGDCPEELTLNVRVFDDPSLLARFPVVCNVEVVFSETAFRLTPYPMGISDAIDSQVNEIGELLRASLKDKTPVFRGTP